MVATPPGHGRAHRPRRRRISLFGRINQTISRPRNPRRHARRSRFCPHTPPRFKRRHRRHPLRLEDILMRRIMMIRQIWLITRTTWLLLRLGLLGYIAPKQARIETARLSMGGLAFQLSPSHDLAQSSTKIMALRSSVRQIGAAPRQPPGYYRHRFKPTPSVPL